MNKTPSTLALLWPGEKDEPPKQDSSKRKSLRIAPSHFNQRVVDWPQNLILDWSDVVTKEHSEARMKSCECGCGQESALDFLPGHDQKLRATLEARVGGLLALRGLVSAAEAYATGANQEAQLLQQLRATFATARRSTGAA